MALRTRSTPPRPMASPWAKTRSGSSSAPMAGRRTPSSSCPMESWSTSPTASASAAARRGGDWEALFADYREQFPELATEIDQMQRRELPAGWDRNLPSFPPDPKGIAGRDASGQVLNVARPEYSVVPGRLGRSRVVKQDDAQIRRCRRLRSRQLPEAAIFISASASMRWRRSSTVCRCRSCAPSARRSSSSATTPGRRSGSPRSWSFRRSSSSPTTPWATARTGRRISPSSSSYRCAPFPASSCSGRRTPMRSSRLIATSCSCAISRRCSRSRGSRCRPSIVANTRPPPVSRAAPTSWPMLRAARLKSS